VHVRVINPNTSAAMTRSIGVAARAAVSSSCRVTAVHPTMGPASIESHYEEALAVPGLLEQISTGERDGVDAFVIACFGDPGLDAARELATVPVVGIAEAAFHAAAFVARRFGVVTTLARTTGRARELVDRYGFGAACTVVRACEIAVLALDDPASEARRAIADECRLVLDSGAEAVVLGCAGMADLCHDLTAELGVPVVDGVGAAAAFAESLGRLRLNSGARGEYAAPPEKEISGLLRGFSLAGPSA
jgi:allantoin racemase